MLDGATGRRLVTILDRDDAAPVWLIEECAEALGVEPEYFAEWRVHDAHHKYDVNVVGLDAALANFDRWARQQAQR